MGNTFFFFFFIYITRSGLVSICGMTEKQWKGAALNCVCNLVLSSVLNTSPFIKQLLS